MADQLSAKDWLDQGLRKLAESGYTALKAEPLAKAMGVSRGSFYWHFTDIGAFHAAILKHWHEVAAERIIATVEAAAANDNPLPFLLRRVFGEQAIDRRRLGYVESQLEAAGLSPEVARARAQILYWAFLGFALSDKPLPRAQQQAMLEEMLRMAAP
jgi:AcrR family transcriptional regulator